MSDDRLCGVWREAMAMDTTQDTSSSRGICRVLLCVMWYGDGWEMGVCGDVIQPETLLHQGVYVVVDAV